MAAVGGAGVGGGGNASSMTTVTASPAHLEPVHRQLDEYLKERLALKRDFVDKQNSFLLPPEERIDPKDANLMILVFTKLIEANTAWAQNRASYHAAGNTRFVGSSEYTRDNITLFNEALGIPQALLAESDLQIVQHGYKDRKDLEDEVRVLSTWFGMLLGGYGRNAEGSEVSANSRVGSPFSGVTTPTGFSRKRSRRNRRKSRSNRRKSRNNRRKSRKH
jgi:hypothetical protein